MKQKNFNRLMLALLVALAICFIKAIYEFDQTLEKPKTEKVQPSPKSNVLTNPSGRRALLLIQAYKGFNIEYKGDRALINLFNPDGKTPSIIEGNLDRNNKLPTSSSIWARFDLDQTGLKLITPEGTIFFSDDSESWKKFLKEFSPDSTNQVPWDKKVRPNSFDNPR